MLADINVGITIRFAERKDLPEVCAIDDEAFAPYGTSESPSVFEARINAFPGGFIVAETNGNSIVAYGTSEKWLGLHEPVMNQDPALSHQPNGRFFCITAMAVREAWRGKGIGSMILEELIKIAQDENCQAILLETTHAQEFYLRRGFYITGEREQMNAHLKILTLYLE